MFLLGRLMISSIFIHDMWCIPVLVCVHGGFFFVLNNWYADAVLVTLWFSCSWMTGCTAGSAARRTIGRRCSGRRKGCTGLKKVLVDDGLWRPSDAGGTVVFLFY
jgi:hypothetical protein